MKHTDESLILLIICRSCYVCAAARWKLIRVMLRLASSFTGFPHSRCGREGAEQRTSQEAAQTLRDPGETSQRVSADEPERKLSVFTNCPSHPPYTEHTE